MKNILVAVLSVLFVVSARAQYPLIRTDNVSQLLTNNIPLVNKALSAITAGGAVSNDGAGGVWVYFTNSVLASNTFAIQQPAANTTNGRWIRLEGGISTPPTNQEIGFVGNGSTLKIDGSQSDRLQIKIRGTNTLDVLSNLTVNAKTLFKFNDGLVANGSEKNTNYTLTSGDFFIGNTNTAGITNTLPLISSLYNHQVFVIKSGAGVTTTVFPGIGDRIDGLTNDVLGPLLSAAYINDGSTNWLRILAAGVVGTNAPLADGQIPRALNSNWVASALIGNSTGTTNKGSFTITNSLGVGVTASGTQGRIDLAGSSGQSRIQVASSDELVISAAGGGKDIQLLSDNIQLRSGSSGLTTIYNNNTVFMDAAVNLTNINGLSMSGTADIGGRLTFSAGLVAHRRATATNYTIVASDFYVAATVTRTITLLAASSVPAGQEFVIKSVGAGVTTTVALTGGDTIDGVAASDTLGGNASMTYISDGISNWEKN